MTVRSPESPAAADTGLSAELRRLVALAWPVMLASLNWTLLHLTDIYVVGLTGTHEVAVFGASRTLTYIAIMIQIGALAGILVFASRADGAGDKRGTGDALREGLLLALGFGLIVAVPYFLFAEPLLAGIGVTPSLVPESAGVIRIMAVAMPFQLIIISAANFFEGISRPIRVAVINLSILPLNAALAWAWSGGHLGFPRLGADGAALATLVSLVIGAAAFVVSALLMRDAGERGLRDWALARWRAALPGAWRLAGFGLVPAIASGLELAGFSYLIALSTQLGEVATHAFQVIFSLHNLTFSAAIGFASAAGVRVGNAVGEGQLADARRRALIAVLLAVIAMLLFVAIYIGFARPITAVFPGEVAVHILAAKMLLLWAPFILFDGVQAVFTYALRSLGDQVAAGVNNIVAFFLVTGVGGWWLVGNGWGTDGLVIASGAGMVAAALLNGGRFWWISGRRTAASAPSAH
jgi:multidrug resistance protein, MATE family